MPILQIFTTVSRSQIPTNLAQQCAKLLSETLRNKPLNRICVHVAPEQIMYAGSMTSPSQHSAFVCLHSIGSVQLEDNRKTVKALTDLLEKELSIPRDEIRMVFQDLSPERVGFAGLMVPDHK